MQSRSFLDQLGPASDAEADSHFLIREFTPSDGRVSIRTIDQLRHKSRRIDRSF